jgi:hypothetical protein
MKGKVLAFVLAAAVAAFAQGRSGGHPSGPPAGAGPGSMGAGNMGAGMSNSMGHAPGEMGPSNHSNPNSGPQGMSQTQQPLKDSQINGGAFRMLQTKTGMTSDQLQQLYQSSGAKNFGQFVSAVVVSKNLGLDTNQVLDGLKTMSLGKTLQSLGVSSKDSKDAMKKAKQEIKAANKNG